MRPDENDENDQNEQTDENDQGNENDESSEEDDSTARCFIDPIFEEDEINRVNNIKYGSAIIHETQQQQDLLLDAYFPPDSDLRDKRPAVVFMHGGAFRAGNKNMGTKLAKKLTMRGYVVFSVNYRLTGSYWSPESQG